MRWLLLILCLTSLLLSACSSGAAPTAEIPTQTQDPCASATDPGARQRFTLEQITSCLNTPTQVGTFMKNNVKLDGNYDSQACGENCYYPASLVYQNGIDDSDGHAILQCYFLEQNGWDAFMLGLSVETLVGHNVCATNTNGTILVLDDEGQIIGPFQSLTDVAKYFVDKNEMSARGTIRSLKASQVTQVTTDHTSPSVLELPWVSLQY